ncbi:tyrosine-type recombinase/integrase [Nodosilinea sp. FACHB-13]|uniref:tyrosine-type recombinase/integrase n=1 Tax=Cyanophyceae TaxID=3028117 RepID=UPI0016850F87|nr:tyrosine-type recombinase/integrase [Nodosilinea sp. FACHB-13]
MDLKNGTFDPTKAKYRLFPKQEVVQKTGEPRRLDELWELYRKTHRFDADSTEDGYRYALKKLQAFWGEKLIKGLREEDGFKFVDWLMEKPLSQETRKSYLYRIRDEWQWAARRGYGVEPDPWTEAIKGVKLTQKLPSPFTRVEIEELISIFQTEERLTHYADYVRVALNLGCRPGELLGLRWKHLAKDFSRVNILEQLTRKKERKLPKKGKTRAIPLNETAKEILKRR